MANETSFRIGCGRYIQQSGALSLCGDEVTRLGRAPLIVGGPTALSLTRDTIEKSIGEKCAKYRFITHGGTCNDDDAELIAHEAVNDGFDVIVGVGGGVMMDFAKLCAHFAGLPIINIPTSSATCAAYTPMSVRYTREGHTVGTLHYGDEVNAVIADPEVIARQPVRLLLSGVFDALAKFVEINQRYDETKDNPLGLDWAYTLAQKSYKVLNDKTEKCIADMKAGLISRDVEEVIFTTIAVTGVISGIARGHNQCAAAHKFYETTRTLYHDEAKPYLHGEIVGVGLILQNNFNGTPEANAALRDVMRKYGMPSCIGDVGVPATEEAFERYYDKMCKTSAVNGADAHECAKFRDALWKFWNVK